MLNEFYFNPEICNMWEVYEAIKHFYPIGIPKSDALVGNLYNAYPGMKELGELLTQHIHNHDNFQQTWVKFTDEIQDETGKKVIGTTNGQAPSFSSSLLIHNETVGECTHQKELNFSVSLLGNFYQIYGVDETIIYNDEERKYYISINVVTPSPFKEFKELFDFVEGKLKARFPAHKIIPYLFGQKYIRGLHLHYVDDEDCTVNQALFNQFLSIQSRYPTRGEEAYGMDQWRLPNSKGGGWRVI